MSSHSLVDVDVFGYTFSALVPNGSDAGAFTCPSLEGYAYFGQFKGSEIHGHGEMVYHDGTVYSGQWEHSKIHNYGEYAYANGNTFTGQFVDGRKHGLGEEEMTDRTRIRGTYVNGNKHGRMRVIDKYGKASDTVYVDDVDSHTTCNSDDLVPLIEGGEGCVTYEPFYLFSVHNSITSCSE